MLKTLVTREVVRNCIKKDVDMVIGMNSVEIPRKAEHNVNVQ
jgi:hypothetical protein